MRRPPGSSARRQSYRSEVAELLYSSPRWCRDLLGITTARPALSAKPQGTRPFFDKPLRGRDDELAWLKGQSGDVLIVGQPGIGKTFLLMHYWVEADGLFAVTDDVGAIDCALREQCPKAVLVSDSHVRAGLLQGLRQLRSDTGGTWRIVADCWPGARPDVQSSLGVADSQVLELPLLARNIILDVIRDIGIIGPNALLRELVDQARGRAGLAATLAWLCLLGDVRQVALGEAISREIETGLTALLGKEAIDTLTLFSFGGGRGLRLADVAQELKVPELQLQRTVIRDGALKREKTESIYGNY